MKPDRDPGEKVRVKGGSQAGRKGEVVDHPGAAFRIGARVMIETATGERIAASSIDVETDPNG